MNPRPTLLLLAVAALAASPRAQCSKGPFIGIPFALALRPPGVGGGWTGAEIYHRAIGFGPSVPQTWSGAPALPRFSFQVAAGHCSFWNPPYPDIDALSIGADWIMANAQGRVSVPLHSWGALAFSVTPGTQGSERSTIRAEAARRDGAISDLFTYTLPGSDLPSELVGTNGMTHRAVDQGEIDLAGSFAGADVDGLDLFVQLFQSVDFVRNSMQTPATMYFSVTPATVNNMPPGLRGMSAATIFQMTWNSTTARWNCPTVWKTATDLGLNDNEDVDALAIDTRTHHMLFSTRSRARNPILFLDYAADHSLPVPYTDANGTAISTHIGLINDDDIDAICAMDPSTVATAGVLNGFAYFMGTPRPKDFPTLPAADLDASAFRRTAPNGFTTFASGWPRSGPDNGFALLFATPKDAPLELVFLGIVARDPRDLVCGNPVRLDVPVPVAPAFRNMQVDLRWFVTNATATSVHEAWPIEIRL